MMPAARLVDFHACPAFTPGGTPHVGGPITMGCSNVLIGFMPAARLGDMTTCAGGPGVVCMGSSTVLIGFMPAARLGDMAGHGGSIVSGFPTVIIGG